MFANREKELKVLNKEYQRKGSSFTIIYGRRRVGKTTLIREYIKDKPSIFFYATDASIDHQLRFFTDLIIDFIGKAYLKEITFNSFEQAFIFLSENIKNKKIVLAIDEYQNMSKLDSSFSSIIQKVWDNNLKTENIHLILCGSAISMMYSQTLSYSSPLYGRRTSSIFLKQMEFKHIAKFVKNISFEDQMNIFAAFGTIPKYLELFDANKSFIENVKNQILDKNSYLYNEVKFLIREEISEPVTYFTILEIISKGDTKIGKIASKMNVPASHLTRYMQRLIDLDIVKKEVPVTEKNPAKSKLGRYRIKDNFINFWFYYVFMNQSYLEIGNIDYVVDRIETSFNEKFVSFAFEDYVLEILLEYPIKYLGFIPIKIGRWWNNKEEIDIVAIGEKKVAFIECKWQSQKVGHNVLLELLRKSKLVKIDPNLEKVMAVFSKSGFKNGVEKARGKFFSFDRGLI
jgi:uncharacterized protein